METFDFIPTVISGGTGEAGAVINMEAFLFFGVLAAKKWLFKTKEFKQILHIGLYQNKAGYTAISCGRVGRGGNATVRN